MRFKIQIQLLAMALLSFHTHATVNDLSAQIELLRVGDTRWQATVSLSQPVTGYRVFPAGLKFRQRAWRLLTPDVSLTETDAGGLISAGGEPFRTFTLEFGHDSDFEADTYVPVLPYSDGGAAVYTGHFSGDVEIDGNWRSVPTRFLLRGREGEQTLLPPWASEASPVYAYVGAQLPLEADQVVMLVDPAVPDWLRQTLEQSIPAATATLARRLGQNLENKPLVFLAAGELTAFEGYSVKGGGLDGQFTIMLRGRDLLKPTQERQHGFEMMVAHELVHVWQQAMPGGEFNPEQPWLHEGSAEALAVAALRESGMWPPSRAETYLVRQQDVCSKSLGSSDLPTAAAEENWTAIYSCGCIEFSKAGDDPFEIWLGLIQEAHRQGRPYTQEMLESVRGPAPHNPD